MNEEDALSQRERSRRGGVSPAGTAPSGQVRTFVPGRELAAGAGVIEVRPLGPRDPLAEPSLARDLAQRYLIWDAHVGGARRVDVHPLVLSQALHDAAVRAAEGVVRAVGAVAARAHDDAIERARYGLHADVTALAAASHRAGDDAALVRVDLLLGDDGRWRACEVNADCPGGHNEALGLPRMARAAGYMRGSNPTHVVERLADRLVTLADGGAIGLVYATAYAEDLQVCAIVQRALLARGAAAVLVPPTAPRMRDGDLTASGLKLRALYRYFPAEYMEGQSNLGDLIEAVASRKTRTLTSFSHIFLQSKTSLARAWACAPSLGREDAMALCEHVPETLDAADVPASRLAAERAGWVLKRALGRVGDQVFVGPLFEADEWGGAVREVLRRVASGERWVAQRFVPQRAIATPWGDRLVTLGAYVLDGVFAGYFARITRESHVSHDALCVPVFAEGSS
jgi:glutathionylspermidine synthase